MDDQALDFEKFERIINYLLVVLPKFQNAMEYIFSIKKLQEITDKLQPHFDRLDDKAKDAMEKLFISANTCTSMAKTLVHTIHTIVDNYLRTRNRTNTKSDLTKAFNLLLKKLDDLLSDVNQVDEQLMKFGDDATIAIQSVQSQKHVVENSIRVFQQDCKLDVAKARVRALGFAAMGTFATGIICYLIPATKSKTGIVTSSMAVLLFGSAALTEMLTIPAMQVLYHQGIEYLKDLNENWEKIAKDAHRISSDMEKRRSEIADMKKKLYHSNIETLRNTTDGDEFFLILHDIIKEDLKKTKKSCEDYLKAVDK